VYTTVTHVLVVLESLAPMLPIPAAPGTPDPDEHGMGTTVPLMNGPHPPLLELAVADVGVATVTTTMQVRIRPQNARPA